MIAAITSCTHTRHPLGDGRCGAAGEEGRRGGCRASRGSRARSPPARGWSPTTTTAQASPLSGEARLPFLASPPLVVAYAWQAPCTSTCCAIRWARTATETGIPARDLAVPRRDRRRGGRPPARGHVHQGLCGCVRKRRARRGLPAPEGDTFEWDAESTYVRKPPFFDGIAPSPSRSRTSRAPACLLSSATRSPPTTSHPAGAIKTDSRPALPGRARRGPQDFNSYGSRRGNHEVMIRGTFANIRLRNQLVPGIEGGFTRLHATASRARSTTPRSTTRRRAPRW